jgi:hypothetical protein
MFSIPSPLNFTAVAAALLIEALAGPIFRRVRHGERPASRNEKHDRHRPKKNPSLRVNL